MKPEDELGVDTRLYDPALYDEVNRELVDDRPFYDALCGRAGAIGGGKVLELCCGSGRLSLPLAAAGHDLTGLDRNEAMLAAAREKAARVGVPCTFLAGDMRDFNLPDRFALIFIPFNSLQNLYTLEDFEQMSERVAVHLEPDGLFAFDVFNPSIELMMHRSVGRHPVHTGRLTDGRRVIVEETCAYDAASQTNRVNWFNQVGNETFTAGLDMRCFYPLELLALLKYNGWIVRERYGDFSGAPFDSRSSKQIFVCTRRDF